jgi:hypothetical protein
MRAKTWTIVWALATLFVAWSSGAVAQTTGERLNDNGVRELMEAVNQARDRFEDQLDGDVKSSIMRSATGEVAVSRYLDDLQENVQRMKDRFRDDYAASAEVETVLKQGTDIDAAMKKRPASLRGQSEWDAMAKALDRLARSYGTTFPLADKSGVRRMNDREVAQTADRLASDLERFQQDVDKLKLDPAQAKAIKSGTDSMRNLSRTLNSRAGDGKPAAVEAKQLFETSKQVRDLAGKLSLSPAGAKAWTAAADGLAQLMQAFNVLPAPPR